MIRLAVILGVVFFAAFAPACCVWDRDSLSTERRGMEAVEDVLTGKVERFPADYYEMRLVRMAKAVETDPFDLPAYDDAGAACDRLGRYDEAMAWMEKKRLAISAATEGQAPKDHRFSTLEVLNRQSHRRLVNEASFAIHRWLATGARADRIDEVSAARAMIVQARKLNSSFGSERYLLIIIDWLIEAQGPEKDRILPDLLGLRLADKTARGPNDALKDKNLSDCFEALAGLVRGSALWENVDLFYALSLAFAVDGRQSLSYMARLRAFELIDQGKGSVVPGAPQGPELKKLLVPHRYKAGRLEEVKVLNDEARREVEAEFQRRRDFAVRWQAARFDYMKSLLEMGSHPDLDYRFWTSFKEPTQLARELPKVEPDAVVVAPLPAPVAEATPSATQAANTDAPTFGTPGTLAMTLAASGVLLLLGGLVWFGLKRRERDGAQR